MPVTTILLNTGCHEETDQRILTEAKLRTVRNGRLDREGRIRVRAGYTALSAKLAAGATASLMVAHDIASLNSRLVALGDIDETPNSGTAALGYPVDLFEYTGLTAMPWRGASKQTSKVSLRPLPFVTDMRDLGVIGDVVGGARDASCSALGGHVLVGWDARGDTSAGITGQSYARVLLAETSQLLVSSTLVMNVVSTHIPQSVRCTRTASMLVAVAADFNSSGTTRLNLFGFTYTPGTSTDLTKVSTALITVAGKTLGLFSVCTVTAGDGIALAVIEDVGAHTVLVRRYDSALAVVVPSSGQYANIVLAGDPTAIAIEADVTSDTLTVACVVGTTLKVTSYVLSTGATIGIPPYGATMLNSSQMKTTSYAVGMCRVSATQLQFALHIVGTSSGYTTGLTTDGIQMSLYTPATHVESAGAFFDDSAPASMPLSKDGTVMMAVRRGPNETGDVLLLDASHIQPLAAPDLGTRGNFDEFPADLTQDPTTGLYYWCRMQLSSSASEIPQVTEFQAGASGRRQMVEIAGSLYISGGVVLQYDGKTLNEAGWLERPHIVSITPSNGSGTLDNSHTYTYVTTWEYIDANGDVSRGPVSEPLTVTMGVADDTNAVLMSRPLTLRVGFNATDPKYLNSYRTRLWRNTVDVVSAVEVPSANLQLVGEVATSLRFAGPVSFTDTASDASVIDNEILYTQVQTPLENHAPQPAKYLSPGSECLMTSGLPRRNRWNVSKQLQPAETIGFAQNGVLNFEGRVQRGELQQALGFAQSWLLITDKELWALNGVGPDLRGVGEFQRQYRIPSDGGMRSDGWRSVVEFGQGVLFQLEDDQLYLWAGGAPKPCGLEIQDTMAEFPNVVAACHVKGQQCVALALQNDAGSDGCIVLWDQQTGQWFRDDVGAVDSLAEHDGRLAYLQDGVVYLEDEDYGSGTAVPLTLATGNVAKSGVSGAGGCERMVATGVYQGDCTVEMRIKYTDDQSFTSLGSQSLLAADGYTAGDPFDLEWAPNRDDVSRFELELLVTSTATNTKQAWCNAIEVHYDIDNGPKRMGDARRR